MIYAEPEKIYTLEEYLDLDFKTDAKYEFFDGKLTEISGVSINHSQINMNLLGMFYDNLGEKFQFWMGDMKLKAPVLPPYRYPNFSVSPKAAEFEIIVKHHCLLNPIVVGEIYSTETRNYDCGEKFEAYKSIKSFREYLLVDQDRKSVKLHTKYDDDVWFESEFVGNETLKLKSLECELNVDEIYQGIVFETEDNRKKFLNGEEII